MSDDRRVAVLAFDAAELAVVRDELEAGRLPSLGALLERGTAVLLRPATDAFPGAVWPTTVTGADLAEHGLHFHRVVEAGTYRVANVVSDALRRPPFWRHVSDAGRESVVVGVYAAPPLEGFRGVQAIGWGSLDPYWRGFDRAWVEPPDARRRLREAVRRRVHYYVPPPLGRAAADRHAERLIRGAAQQAEGILALAAGTDWSLLVAGFSEAHHGGHLLWHAGEEGDRPDSPLRRVYRAIDAGIGTVVARLPADTAAFVMTPHGMGPSQLRCDPIDAVLERGGWLVRPETRTARTGGNRARATAAARRVARTTLPFRVRAAIRLRLLRAGRLTSHDITGVEWSRTAAFSLPADLVSYVRLNVAGREPEGIVPPGERRAMGDEITRALHELRVAGSGTPAVRDVVWSDELWAEQVGSLPDLIVVWALDAPVEALTSPRLGTIELAVADARTGHHRLDGFLVGAGPGIEGAGAAGFGGEAWDIRDVAPTILSVLGIEPPPGLAGRPIAPFVAGAGTARAGRG